jgi:hypothetical protein
MIFLFTLPVRGLESRRQRLMGQRIRWVRSTTIRCAISWPTSCTRGPFPPSTLPSRAAYLAIKPAQDAAARDRDADRAHLVALLDRFGAGHPAARMPPTGSADRQARLKWESHTEFTTYTSSSTGWTTGPSIPSFDIFPADWLAEAPGTRMTSALIRIELGWMTRRTSRSGLDEWFVAESLAVSTVLEGDLVIGADFRIDAAGHQRIAIFAHPKGPENAAWADRAAAVRDRDLQDHVDAGAGAGTRGFARDGRLDRRSTAS